MPNLHVHSLLHNASLIDKKVIIYTRDKSTVGFLQKVEQVVYGVKPVYHLVVEGQVFKEQGILIPYSVETEKSVKDSPRLATENFIFAPFKFEDF